MILKAYHDYKRNVLFRAILLFFIVFVTGCSSTKYIADYQSIVKKVEIDSIPKKFEEEALNYIQKDIRPSSKIGINVLIYNMFNTKDGKYKTNNVKPLGTPPPILDSTLVEISRNQIEKYLISKGYFNAKVESEIKVENKRAEILFKADTGKVFTINKVKYEIPDDRVKELYLSDRAAFTHLKEGNRYDDDSLGYERDQIYQVMKQKGYFDFSRPYIKFLVDSNLNANKANVTLIIDNPIDKPRHLQYTLGETNIIIAPNSDGFPDSIKMNNRVFRNVRYTDLSGKFRRNPIVRYNFLHPGDQYDIRNENVTYDRMYELNVFKNVKIDYNKKNDSSNTVNPVLQLIPQKIMSNRIEGEVPFNNGTVGFTLSNTYTNNNLFRGAEKFEFQIKGGLQARLGQGRSFINEIYQRDFSVGTTLTVPRLMIPFSRSRPGKGGMPHTIFSASYVYALQKDFFQRKVILTSVAYEFRETRSKFHTVTPLNFEYRFGGLLFDKTDTTNINYPLIVNNYANLLLLERKNVTFGIKYAYTLNGEKLATNNSFIYFKGDIDLAGNMLQGLSKLFGSRVDSTGAAMIFGVPFNQYVRPEFDIRWYKGLGGDKQFVARLNVGIAYAYGNSKNIPFEKLFYAGGSSGVRAWQARTLGPGNYNRGESIETEQGRRLLYGFDQTGELHIESNFEYRYKLLNKFFGAKLKGAIFLDAGNVWNVSNGESKTRFDFKSLGSQIALGAGTGFRYDVQYFVFRFDIGLKLKDPQFTGSDQWVINKFLSGGKAFRSAYDAANSPDRYRFVQYNFGIGMPF
ncbi:BamA/TamA family outer membrane protein [Pedobacter sp. ASV1-7]|uniref:translocation and assembly module lipoprotein TamL n=1 Tax=Pedobacter sp. ASV1-7 TaxID=3145237 RepID=UPI0032E8A6D1